MDIIKDAHLGHSIGKYIFNYPSSLNFLPYITVTEIEYHTSINVNVAFLLQ